MKKLIVTALIVMLVLSFVGCAQQTAQEPTQEEATAESTDVQEVEQNEPSKPIVIGFANLTDTLDVGKLVKYGVIKAAEERGYEIIALDNERTGTKAIENAQILADRGIDVFIEFNVDRAVAETVMDIMNEKNIPVIAIDIPHPGAAFFGANNWEAGQIVGNALADKAEAEWNGACDLVILAENAKAGEVVKQRMLGIEDALISRLNILKDQIIWIDGEGDLLVTQQQVADTLTANPDKKNILIGTLQDPMGQGAFAAVVAAGREDQVWLASQGADIHALTNLIDEEPNCWFGSVSYEFHKYGEYIMELADEAIAGEELPENTYVDHVFIDRGNAKEYYDESYGMLEQ